MPAFRGGTNPVWAGFAVVYMVGAIALSVYWLISLRGPVGWLAEWQAETFDGSWYPKITVAVVLIGLLVPLVVIKLLFEAITGKRLTRKLTREDFKL